MSDKPLQAASVAPPNRWVAFAILAVLFLAATDTTIIGTLLPVIAGSVGGGQALFPWLMSGFMVAMALAGPLTGALADRYGVRSVLSWAILVFLAGSAGAALSSDMLMLVLARVVQGAGAGMIIVLSYASLAIIYGASQRGRVQSMVSIVWGVAAIVGPLAGLAFTHAFGWRAAFLINMPVGLVCLLVLRSKALSAHVRRGVAVDYLAQGFFALMLLGVMVALSAAQVGLSRDSFWSMLVLAAAGALLLVLRVMGRPQASPVPLAFFQQRSLAVAMVIVICGSIGLYASITLVPIALHARHAIDTAQTGIIVLLAALGFVVSSAVCGMQIQRVGYRSSMLAGALALVAGAFVLAMGSTSLPWQAIAGAELLIGLGMGCVAVGAVVLAQNAAPADAVATYTSTIQLLRNVGAALGINALAAIQYALESQHLSNDSLRSVFSVLGPVFVVCALLALLLPSNYQLQPAAVPGQPAPARR
ncbi:MFS transporter [Massilia sp. BJB1822]|uniref:MFS transporter n=1 Tax=Massilia sp. BJB1822 TaxID=2744470 RepID=UPI001593C12D|nr:MFS transporter [Massilia sp. BJB1822]NVD98438.1 MFS transporter [Massilia sp. BJB1822]